MGLEMLTGIISIVLCLFFIVSECDYANSILGRIWVCIYAPVVTAIVWVVCTTLIALILSIFPAKHYVPSTTSNIVAIGDGHMSEGNSFLGCGSMQGVPYYFYYEKTKKGGYKQGKIKTEDANVFEVDSLVQPKIQFYKSEFVNKGWENWTVNVKASEKADIYIPKGSIKQNFSLDLN